MSPGNALYNHNANIHTVDGAARAFEVLFKEAGYKSVLDVGCGVGMWMRAAIDAGIPDVRGVDGVALSDRDLQVPGELIQQVDLTKPWSLDRKFDVVFCLEVAEHLPASCAADLVEQLTKHADLVVFSAASPWQLGQNHLNCQWPAYWQGLFNQHGYVCRDRLRWKIWDQEKVEPWYRQNMFLAEKSPQEAGQEERIPAVVHPAYMLTACENWQKTRSGLIETTGRWLRRTFSKQDGGFPYTDA